MNTLNKMVRYGYICEDCHKDLNCEGIGLPTLCKECKELSKKDKTEEKNNGNNTN